MLGDGLRVYRLLRSCIWDSACPRRADVNVNNFLATSGYMLCLDLAWCMALDCGSDVRPSLQAFGALAACIYPWGVQGCFLLLRVTLPCAVCFRFPAMPGGGARISLLDKTGSAYRFEHLQA